MLLEMRFQAEAAQSHFSIVAFESYDVPNNLQTASQGNIFLLNRTRHIV